MDTVGLAVHTRRSWVCSNVSHRYFSVILLPLIFLSAFCMRKGFAMERCLGIIDTIDLGVVYRLLSLLSTLGQTLLALGPFCWIKTVWKMGLLHSTP